MTVSRDIAPARPVQEPDVEPAPAVPSQYGVPARPAVPPQAGGSRPGGSRPATARPSSSVTDVVRVRRGVEALRRALAQGTVHHHGGGDAPAARRAPGVEVVRAWADGQGLDEQRRVCRTCGAAAR